MNRYVTPHNSDFIFPAGAAEATPPAPSATEASAEDWAIASLVTIARGGEHGEALPGDLVQEFARHVLSGLGLDWRPLP